MQVRTAQGILHSRFQETLKEYLLTYDQLVDKLDRLDKRIEELASAEPYKEDVAKLSCFIGVKTITALAVLTEVGDLNGSLLHNNFPHTSGWCLGRIPVPKTRTGLASPRPGTGMYGVCW